MIDATPLLSLRAMRVRFGGLAALDVDALDLDGRAGACTVIMGPNGAGKTTLLNATTGYARLEKGSSVLLYDGERHDLARRSRDAIVRAGIARTFQSPPVFGSLTARHAVRLALLGRRRRSSLGGGWARTLSMMTTVGSQPGERQVLESLGLGSVADQPMQTLPLAVLRRAELARCVATEPRLLFLDEPTAGADDPERDRLVQFVTKGLSQLLANLRDEAGWSRETVTICAVTHDLRLARDLASASNGISRAVILNRGSVLADGPLHEVLAASDVRREYLGEGTVHA